MTKPIRRFALAATVAALAVLARPAHAQSGAAGAVAVAPDSSALVTVYMKEGASIRGWIVADNGPNGLRVRSQKSGSVFVIPAARIDSVVRPKAPVPAMAVTTPEAAPVPATPTPAISPGPVAASPTTIPSQAALPSSIVAVASAAPAQDVPAPIEALPTRADSTPNPEQSDSISPAAVPATTIALPQQRMMEGLAPPPPADTTPAPQAISLAATVETPDSAAADTAAHRTTVTFISGTEIYIGAGRVDGLVEGSEVSVMREDEVVGTLRVKFLASHRAACEVVSGAEGIALGDAIEYHRQQAAPLTLAASAVAPMPSRPHRLSGPGLHGRFGTRYLHANTTTVDAGQELGSNGFTQPSLDARVNGMNLGGSPLGMALDLRTRQTTTTSLGGTTVDGHTRVYQALMFWNAPGSGFHAAAGRQYLTAVSSIGLLDGALAELTSSRMTFGAFAGFEPDAATLGFSGAVHDYGAYVGVHNRPGNSTAASATIGAIGSWEGSQARRQWGIVQFNVNNRQLSLYVLQEIDYYQPWKLQGPNAEASAISFTSQFASVSVRPARWVSINGTYDKRRSVPTLRDFTNPETQFDDTYRQGYGGGVQLTGGQFYGGGDWRRSTGGIAGGANSFTSTFGVNRLTSLNLGMSVRATWYGNDVMSADTTVGLMRTSGQLYSARLSVDPFGPIHLDLNGGLRREDNPVFTSIQESTWYGVDMDLNLARAWFVSFSALHQSDSANPGTSTLSQLYGGITWRF